MTITFGLGTYALVAGLAGRHLERCRVLRLPAADLLQPAGRRGER